jgi:hypothetical protein
MQEPALSWERLVVDDFPAAFAHHRRTMDLTARPRDGEAAILEHGYARFWRCSRPGDVEVELVARDKARRYLGEERFIDDRTLVYYAPDVDAAFAGFSKRYEPVLEPTGDPRDAPSGERYAQFRDTDGTLLELRVSWVASFGGLHS